ncbi:MAG TPA: hypothetical protein DGH68_05160, partial [Bacteroidetes bacterium]|nr:hypothetical protein [Bacteroidota bacterium]
IYSIVVLVVLAVITFFALNREGEVSSIGSSGKMLVDYDSMSVDKLEVVSPTGSVILEKQAGTWMVMAPIKYKADEAAVTSAVGKGRKIELTSLVSANPEKQKLFQVDSSGTLVKVYEKGSPKAAFRIGKASSSYTETYVRLEGSNEVQLTNETISSYFTKLPKDWRDKIVFKMDEGKIRTVKFHYGDTTFALSLQDSMWRIEKDSVNQTAVKSLLSALANIQTDEFIDSALAAIPKLTAVIEVEGTQIRFVKKDDTKYLVQTSQSAQWFELQSWRTTSLLKRRKDLLPAKL